MCLICPRCVFLWGGEGRGIVYVGESEVVLCVLCESEVVLCV